MMLNVSTFRAMHGSRLERLDYKMFSGVESMFNVIVISETRHSITVEGTVTDESGGSIIRMRLGLDNIVEVFE